MCNCSLLLFVLQGSSGQYIRATLPYIRTEIPIIIVFRALGFVADKDILEHICYDFNDTQMMELLRPSLEEAFVIQNQQVLLVLIRCFWFFQLTCPSFFISLMMGYLDSVYCCWMLFFSLSSFLILLGCSWLHREERGYSWCYKGKEDKVCVLRLPKHLAASDFLKHVNKCSQSIFCRYAKEILQKEMLPHVGIGEYCETKKAYYFG